MPNNFWMALFVGLFILVGMMGGILLFHIAWNFGLAPAISFVNSTSFLESFWTLIGIMVLCTCMKVSVTVDAGSRE